LVVEGAFVGLGFERIAQQCVRLFDERIRARLRARRPQTQQWRKKCPDRI
jgi:hypothetical protein